MNWNNTVFKNVFPIALQGNLGAIPFVAAEAMIKSGHAPNTRWYKQDRHEQFHFIANECKRILAIEPSATIAILARSRSIINPIFNIFKQYHLAFQSFGLDPLLESLNVEELYNLCAFIEKPNDNLLCATVLRSRIIGMSNVVLYHFCSLANNNTLWEHINDPQTKTSERFSKRMATVLPHLAHTIEQRKTTSLRQVLFDLIKHVTPIAYYNVQDQQPIWLFLESLQKAEQLSPQDPLPLLLKILSTQHLSGSEQNIKIMTIHKAKGLEFDYVFIPGLGSPTPSRSQKLLWWDHIEHLHDRTDYILIPNHQPGIKPSKLNTYLYQKENSKTINELIRLLYVAGTRAKKQVYWSGAVNEHNVPQPRSPLALIWQGLTTKQQEIQLHNAKILEHANKDIWLSQFNHPIKETISTSHVDNTSKTKKLLINRAIMPNPGFESALGLAVHYLMHFMANHPHECQGKYRKLISNYCLEQGITNQDISTIMQILDTKLNSILNHPKTQWILQKRPSTQTECSVYEKSGKQNIIDICFYDSNDFWIIDYKTHHHEYQHTAKRLGKQHFIGHYEQLCRYYTILSNHGIKRIRCGLYFPLSGSWHEILVKKHTEKVMKMNTL